MTHPSASHDEYEGRAGTAATEDRGGAAPPDGGLYVLVVRLSEPTSIGIGSLGRRLLDPGWYLYTGSARKNLGARIRRHLARRKKVRWHIDHLTTHRDTKVVGALIVPEAAASDELCECRLNGLVAGALDATAPVPRFGASDCRGGCPAHLWHVPATVLLIDLLAGLGRVAELAAPNGGAVFVP